jgi:hypothetical protein
VEERLYRRMRQAGRGLEKWERRWCWRRETCGAEGEVVQQQQAVLIIGASTGHGRYGAGWGVSTCSHKRIDGALGLQNEDWAIPPQQTGGCDQGTTSGAGGELSAARSVLQRVTPVPGGGGGGAASAWACVVDRYAVYRYVM